MNQLESAAAIAHRICSDWIMGPVNMGDLECLITEAIEHDRADRIEPPEGDTTIPLPPPLGTPRSHLAEAIAAGQVLAGYIREFRYAAALVLPDDTLRYLRSNPLEEPKS